MRVSTSKLGLWATAAGIGLLTSPAPAFACPVCGLASTSDNAWAYTVMSAVLMVLPLGMIGGTVFWVARRASRLEASPPTPAPKGVADVPQHQDALQLRAPRD